MVGALKAAKAGNATDPGRDKGVHYSERLQQETKSLTKSAEASNATDPGWEKGVHYSERLQRETKSLTEHAETAAKAGNATDPGQDVGIHYSSLLQRETLPDSERGKLSLGVARRKANGSTPAWIMIESASTPTTFEPKCSNVRNSLISLLISVGAIKKRMEVQVDGWKFG